MVDLASTLLQRWTLTRLGVAVLLASALTGCVTTSPEPQPWPEVLEIRLSWMVWGEVQEEFTVPAGGQARWVRQGSGEADFPVTQAEFERVRDQVRDFEGIPFSCDRVMTDMPTGRLEWSRQGEPIQTLDFDPGCVSGDADGLFDKVHAAAGLLAEVRDRDR